MRRITLLLSFLLLTAVWVFAQEMNQPSGAAGQPTQSTEQYSSQESSMSANMHLRGCLIALNGQYGLEDGSGRVWRLQGDSALLGRYVNQSVLISAAPGFGSHQVQVDDVGPIGDCHY